MIEEIEQEDILLTQEDPTVEVVEEVVSTEEGERNDKGEIVPKTKQQEDQARRQRCWDYYVESVIEGRPNVRGSAIKAGFSPNAINDIAQSKWFLDKKKGLKRSVMLSRAEKNLNDVLRLPYMVQKQKDGVPYMEVDTDILRIVMDVSKSLVKSLGKDEGYSERSEVTGKDGQPIVFMPPSLISKYKLEE